MVLKAIQLRMSLGGNVQSPAPPRPSLGEHWKPAQFLWMRHHLLLGSQLLSCLLTSRRILGEKSNSAFGAHLGFQVFFTLLACLILVKNLKHALVFLFWPCFSGKGWYARIQFTLAVERKSNIPTFFFLVSFTWSGCLKFAFRPVILVSTVA